MIAKPPVLTATFYHFVPLADLPGWQQRLRAECAKAELFGTILLATEGINATLCGPAPALRAFLTALRDQAPFAGLRYQESVSDTRPLRRLKVKIKREIVSLRAGPIDLRLTGTHVAPADWNALIQQADMVVVDARNRYETAVGTFAGAIDPRTDHFSELPAWLLADDRLRDKPPVAMFCTGGVRCEKSTAWLKAQGFDRVYQLDGGILNYLRSVPREASLWQGDCFVFDERIAVDHELHPTDTAQASV